jgi:hypothetical protein
MKKYLLIIVLMVVATVTFGQEVEPVKDKSTFQLVWEWISLNWGWIASVLFIISEALASSKMKENSIYQLIMSWLKKKSTKISQ